MPKSYGTLLAGGAAISMFSVSAQAQLTFQDQTAARLPGPHEYTNQVSFCDIDGDGDLDIAMANGQGYSSQGAALKLRILINDGTGVFADETDARTGGFAGWARGVEFGDCDGDGDPDMVVAQDFNKRPQLFINGLGGRNHDVPGYFVNETQTRLPLTTLSSARAEFGDVDNDGDLDLFLCNSGTTNRFGSGQPKLYINGGTGFYTDQTATMIPVGNVGDQQDAIFGDVDSDLDLDLLLVSRNNPSLLWINSGSGVFANTAFPADGASYSFDFGDANGDGDLDLISIEGGTDRLFGNNGTGTFTNISSEISPNGAIDDNDSKFFDYDNDGDLDYVVASLGSVERIFRNNGVVAGADFTQVTGLITTVSDTSLDVKVGDVTGDGKLDIYTAQGEGGNVDKLYVNIGGPTFVDNRSPKITLEQVPSPSGTYGPFVVRAVAYDDYTSDRGFYDKGVSLHYTVDNGPESVVIMKWMGNSMWRGVIPEIPSGSKLDYFGVATDWAGNVGTSTSLSVLLPEPPPCDGDFDANQNVDTDDLLFVINSWGDLGGPADLDGSGVVDVDDLLIVINNWGPCD